MTDYDPDYWWSLLKEGEYAAVSEGLAKRKPRWTDTDWREAGTLGKALICQRRYVDAATAYQLASDMAKRDRGHKLLFSDMIGGALWLSANRAEALRIWRDKVEGLNDGSVEFTDASGGMRDVLLLWYGAVSLAERDEATFAIKMMKKRSRN